MRYIAKEFELARAQYLELKSVAADLYASFSSLVTCLASFELHSDLRYLCLRPVEFIPIKCVHLFASAWL